MGNLAGFGQHESVFSTHFSALSSSNGASRPPCPCALALPGSVLPQPQAVPPPSCSLSPPAALHSPSLPCQASRESLVYMAKLAEEAERYDDMVASVKSLAELDTQLNVEVRAALAAAGAAAGRPARPSPQGGGGLAPWRPHPAHPRPPPHAHAPPLPPACLPRSATCCLWPTRTWWAPAAPPGAC